mgnify:CR=1 FL=1
MSMELADTFKTNSYSVKGFKRSRMQKNLLTNDPLEPECLFYLADFLQVNIFIVKHKYYYCLNQIDDKTSDRVSIVIYYGVPDDSTTTTNTIDTYYSVLGEQKDSQYFKTSKLLEMFSDSDLTCISSESSQGITNNSGMLPKASQLKKMKVAELKDGQFVGEMSFLTEKSATADCVVKHDTECILWKQPEFKELLKRNPSLYYTIQGLLSNQLISYSNKK